MFVITEPGFQWFNIAIQWNSLFFEGKSDLLILIAHKINEVSLENGVFLEGKRVPNYSPYNVMLT